MASTKNCLMMKLTKISNSSFQMKRLKLTMVTLRTQQQELETLDQRKKPIFTGTPTFTQQFLTKSKISSSLLALVEMKCVFSIGTQEAS